MIDLKTPVNQIRYHVWRVVGSDNLYPISFNVKFEDDEEGLDRIINAAMSDQKETLLLGQIELPKMLPDTLDFFLGNIPLLGNVQLDRSITKIQVYLDPLIGSSGHKEGYIINAGLYPHDGQKIDLSPYDFKPDFEHDYYGNPNFFRSSDMPLDIFDKYFKLTAYKVGEDEIVSLSHTMVHTNDLTKENAKAALQSFVKTLELAVELVYKDPVRYESTQTLVLDLNKSVSLS